MTEQKSQEMMDELRRLSGINGDTDIMWKAADEILHLREGLQIIAGRRTGPYGPEVSSPEIAAAFLDGEFDRKDEER